MNDILAMDRLMTILKQRNPDLNHRQLGELTGIHRTNIGKLFSGASDNSNRLADWMARKYGGECEELRDMVRANHKRAIGCGGNADKQEGQRVDMHHVPPIDPDDILALLLPVVHPQQVNLGTPRIWSA